MCTKGSLKCVKGTCSWYSKMHTSSVHVNRYMHTHIRTTHSTLTNRQSYFHLVQLLTVTCTFNSTQMDMCVITYTNQSTDYSGKYLLNVVGAFQLFAHKSSQIISTILLAHWLIGQVVRPSVHLITDSSLLWVFFLSTLWATFLYITRVVNANDI